jgi:hypothetical protein
VKYGVAAPGPTLDTSAFPAAPAGNFWSSTPLPGQAAGPSAYVVDYSHGNTFQSPTSHLEYVRCVRGGGGPVPTPSAPADAPPGRYVVSTPGVAYDTKTGLTWEQTPNALGQIYPPGSAQDAQRYCAGLGLAGGAWRVPEVAELLTLVDFTKAGVSGAAAIDTCFFGGTPADRFWTATAMAGQSQPWGVDFLSNTSNVPGSVALQGTTGYVRCVR